MPNQQNEFWVYRRRGNNPEVLVRVMRDPEGELLRPIMHYSEAGVLGYYVAEILHLQGEKAEQSMRKHRAIPTTVGYIDPKVAEPTKPVILSTEERQTQLFDTGRNAQML